MEALFFDDAAALRAWLAEQHATATELWLGFYKRGAGDSGVTYAEALDAALCCGWIDGRVKRIDETRYAIRFSPRKPRSVWSAVNVARAGELAEMGQLGPSGLRAFNDRNQASGNYSYESATRELDAEHEQLLRANAAAWAFYHAQTASYRKAANWWVMSAKRPETRLRRLGELITVSEQGQRLRHLVSPAQRTP